MSDEAMAARFAVHLERIEAHLATRPNRDVLYVEHRRAIEAPGAVARAVRDFLGLELDIPAMARDVDVALHRNRA